MKYVVEVLNPEIGGTRTQIYPDKEAAKTGLNNWNKHRPGQPVIALYKDGDETKALLAIGIQATDKYYIIEAGEEITQYFNNQVSGGNVLIDSIDITKLLSETGPGQDFDARGEYAPYNNVIRKHFGFLGTSSSAAAIKISGGKIFTKPMSSQELFEAILHGTLKKDPKKPEVKVNLSETQIGNWESQLIVYLNEEESKTIYAKYEITNLKDLDSSKLSLATDPLNLNISEFDSNDGTCIRSYIIDHAQNTDFSISASNTDDPDLSDFAIATLIAVQLPSNDKENLSVTTGDSNLIP